MRYLLVPCALFLASAVSASAWTEGAIITSDYSGSGAVSTFLRDDPWTVSPDRATVYRDAVAHWHDGLLYVVNRAGADNIQVLDPAAGYQTVRQYSLGTNRGLHDIAFDTEGEAYVACYDTAELLRIDPVSGQILDVISTAAWADADGRPETGQLLAVGDRLFITCERLDRGHYYQPVGDSYLLVWDMAAEAWEGSILLAGTDPYARPFYDGQYLHVACIGVYGVLDAGVDVVDPVSLTSLGFEITDALAGGDVLDIEPGPGGWREVIVSDTALQTSVRRYRAGEGAAAVILPTSAYDYADLAFDGDFQLYVADHSASAPGLRVFDAVSGAELTSAPLATGLPPVSIVLPEGAVVAAPDLPSPHLQLAAPWPNPANPATQVAWTASAGQAVTLRVLDLRGHELQRVARVTDDRGHGTWRFDGLDDCGRRVASGTYRLVVEGAGGFAARSFSLVR